MFQKLIYGCQIFPFCRHRTEVNLLKVVGRGWKLIPMVWFHGFQLGV